MQFQRSSNRFRESFERSPMMSSSPHLISLDALLHALIHCLPGRVVIGCHDLFVEVDLLRRKRSIAN